MLTSPVNFTLQLESVSQSGSKFSYTVGISGVLLILLACLLWNINWYAAAKDAAAIIVSGGLILALGGASSGYKTNKDLPGKKEMYLRHRESFLKSEKAKVEQVHGNWFRYRIFWIVIAVCGCILLFTTEKKFWLGMGAGALLIGLSGIFIEALSYRINEKYRNAILKEEVRYGEK